MAGKRKRRSDLNEHGFRIGSDSAVIVNILLNGGTDRQELNRKVAEAIDPVTRGGREKNIPSMISMLLSRLEARGYKVESTWRLVPPDKQ